MRVLVFTLLLATSAHAQFILQNSNSTASFRGIHAVNESIAWASGTNGTVLHTTDGGEHWLPCTIPDGAEQLDFRGIQAFDDKTAIVMSSGKGDASRLYKTTDACRTWKLVFTNPDKDGFWDAIRMWNQNEGFLVGDPVNGEMTLLQATPQWGLFESKVNSLIKALPKESAFAASNSSIVLGDYEKQPWNSRDIWFATGGASGARVHHYSYLNTDENRRRILKTTNLPFFPKTASGGVFSIARNKDTFLAVGGDYKNPSESSLTAAYSENAGVTWKTPTTPPHGYRSSVAYSSQLKAFLTVGPNGTDVSYDNGKTWKPVGDNPEQSDNWNALSLPFVVGPKGRIGKLDPKAFQ